MDFDLLPTVEEVIDLLAEQAHGKKIEMGLMISSEVPRLLIGDPARLWQVLMNLVGNAIKFTPEGGDVILRLGLESATPTEAVLRFEVVDTGIGIEPADRARLFVPFSQVDGSATRRFGGTGLGLVIADKLVRLMGGEMGVESDPGQGSTFWFTARFGRQDRPAALPEIEIPRPCRVLVVDDNETNRKILTYQLNAWDMQPLTVASAAEALGVLGQDRPFDLAILDMQMPEVDGLELARRIRSDARFEGLRMVMMTSLDQLGDARLDDGLLDGYLRKPVTQSQLYDCLVNVLAKPRGAAVEFSRAVRHEQTTPIASVPGAADLRVLVAEDNSVNQRVTLRQLRRLGFKEVQAVADGTEAVRAASEIAYDVILMDCQMPNLDGYQATEAIRRQGGQRPVIVALTAHALEGEREKCIAAGMDDYIVKPVDIHELGRMLGRWAGHAPRIREQRRASVLDETVLAALDQLQLEDEADAVEEIASLFIDESEGRMSELRQAAENADAARLRDLFHAFKSASQHVGAIELSALCATLETVAAGGEVAQVGARLDEVEEAQGRVVAALRELRERRQQRPSQDRMGAGA
jgi:CheY-like chemotaxis protein